MPLAPAARARAAVVGARVARSRALRACATALVALGAASTAGAQATTITFNGLTATDASGVRYVDNCYVESGFRFTLVGFACGTAASFGTWTADDPLYWTGSPALFNNLGPSVEMRATSGSAFSLTGLDLAPAFGVFGLPTTVLFSGLLGNGSTITQTVSLPGGTGTPAAFTLSGFTNVVAVTWTVSAPAFEPYVQVDNIRASVAASSVVPEPGTYALVALGLAGVAGVARRRSARAPRA